MGLVLTMEIQLLSKEHPNVDNGEIAVVLIDNQEATLKKN